MFLGLDLEIRPFPARSPTASQRQPSNLRGAFRRHSYAPVRQRSEGLARLCRLGVTA